MAITIQSNIKQYNGRDMHKYSLFLGGLNVTSKALEQYDPLKTGYPRIFFTKMPPFLKALMPERTKQIRHLFEYGFTGIDGIQNLSLEFDTITGGYAGRGFEVPTVAKDDTNSITIKLYEFAGSPIKEYITMWISGIADQYTGYGRYHGIVDPALCQQLGVAVPIKYAQHNHSAEAVFLQTDPTGMASNIEYCCLLTNMVPKVAKVDHFNYDSGQHPIVQVDVEFTATKYESPQINALGKSLLTKYPVMKDYLNFHSGYKLSDVNNNGLFPPNQIENWATGDYSGLVTDAASSTATGGSI